MKKTYTSALIAACIFFSNSAFSYDIKEYCQKVADAGGGSYTILEQCIKDETAAKKRVEGLSTNENNTLKKMTKSASNLGEWEEVAKLPNVTANINTDVTTRHKNGTKVRLHVIWDYEEPQLSQDGEQVYSYRQEVEFECKKKNSRILETAIYFREFGLGFGQITYENLSGDNWVSIKPSTPFSTISKIVCKKIIK